MDLLCCFFTGRTRTQVFFSKFTMEKGLFYLLVFGFYCCCVVGMFIEPFVELPCPELPPQHVFGNPAYVDDACRETRFPQIMYLTPREADFGRRITFATLFGGVIGWERRSADRPAGIRTMALVSLGSCIFTLTSERAFLTGPMNWDASRIAAAIPSGVGFLGAGMIWKQSQDDGSGGQTQTVHGLTTAASLWLSAAVGIASGGGMYFCALFCTGIMVLLLRFGPRITDDDETEEDIIPIPADIEGGSYGSTAERKALVNGAAAGVASTPLRDERRVSSGSSQHSDFRRSTSGSNRRSFPRLV